MKTVKMTIADNRSFLDRLHKDCSPLQEIRELTVNSIQSVLRTSESSGTIIWDVDRSCQSDTKKLCLIDDGDGMTGDQMEQFLNQLSAGAQNRSCDGDTNYGIGAKIAALPLNRKGMIYKSWTQQNGNVGESLCLGLDTTDNSYGILAMSDDNKIRKVRWPVSVDQAPLIIKNAGHGTMVTLMGNDVLANTAAPPTDAKGGAKWISYYLNSKIFSMPETVKLYAREWSNSHAPRERVWSFDPPECASPNMLRSIKGTKQFLDKYAEDKGYVRLENAVVQDGTAVPATAFWWVMKDDNDTKKILQSANGYLRSTGYVATLFYNNGITEIYEPRFKALHKFGVMQQHQRVFIFIKPDNIPQLTTTSGRDRLRIGKYDMPWDDWEEEFSQKLPDPIKDLYSPERNNKSVKDKLRNLFDFMMDIPSFAKSHKNALAKSIQPSNEDGGVRERSSTEHRKSNQNPTTGSVNSPNGTSLRISGNVGNYNLTSEDSDTIVKNDFEIPNLIWYSINPNKALGTFGTPADEDGIFMLQDRGASYAAGPNTIFINYDFRMFQHFITKGLVANGITDNNIKRDIFIRAAMEHTEFQLLETVIGVKLLTDQEGTWSREDIQRALSDESLTAAMIQKEHVSQVLNRNVGQKIGFSKKCIVKD